MFFSGTRVVSLTELRGVADTEKPRFRLAVKVGDIIKNAFFGLVDHVL
jgi:hypothetical protein